MDIHTSLISGIKEESFNALARGLTLVENDMKGSRQLLEGIDINHSMAVIGITGPPGAGKVPW